MRGVFRGRVPGILKHSHALQPALACLRQPIHPSSGPIIKRKRGRILEVGWWGGTPGPWIDRKAQARTNSGGGLSPAERLLDLVDDLHRRRIHAAEIGQVDAHEIPPKDK